MAQAKPAIHIKSENKGKLHRDLGVKADKKIPMSDLMRAKHSSSPVERKRANFAINARKWGRG